MSIGYMWEVFYCGTQSMVTGTGQIQERLENTFRYLMPRLMGPQIDLTPELEEKAHNLMRQVSCKTSKGDEGNIAATCRVMNDDEAKKIAQDLFDIFNEVCRLKAASDAAAPSRAH